MNGNKIVAILVGIAIMFPLEYWLDAPLYIYVPLGAVGFLATRYIGWSIYERRHFDRETKARRDEPLD